MQKFLVFAVVGFAFSQALLFSQAPIQVNTRLVQVVVIARDKRGPITDLSKGDFEIFDKGKSKPISTFSFERVQPASKQAPLPPNTFSNRLDRGDSPVAATVILFDSLNTAFKDQATAREQVVGYLKSIDPSSPVAIYALGNGLRILHDFTDDRARLTRGLERYRGQISTLLDDSTPSPGQDFVSQILDPLQNYSFDRRIAITMSAMTAIADRMAGTPGRKNLIWISGAFPITLAFDRAGLMGGGQRMVTYAGPMKEAATAIDRAEVAVYPVDARGLMVSNTIRTSMPQPINQATTGRTYSVPTPESMIGTREIETMQLLADWTGGKAFYNTNDLRGAIKQATEDADATYVLGFYADEKELDGSYHDLKVKTSRRGADIRYRKGYFAAPVAQSGGQSAIDVLKRAILSPADATGIGLTASLTPNAAQAGSFFLDLHMDLQNLSLEARNGRFADNLNFAVVQQDREGSALDSVTNTVTISVTDENRQKLLQDGLTLKVGIRPAPRLSQIRIAVMDQATGNTGTLRVIPPVTN